MLARRAARKLAQRRLSAPRSSENRYVGVLQSSLRTFSADALRWLEPRLGEIAKPNAERADANTNRERTDASTPLTHDFLAYIDTLVAKLGIETGPEFDKLLGQLLESNARGLSLYGIDVRRLPGLGGVVSHYRAWNVQLMVDAGRDYARDVASVLDDPDSWGLRVEELARKIEARAGVAESHAELIARDQTLRLNGQINSTRQQAAGISDYIWSGVLDERERDTHVAHEGQRFAWAVPPADTGNPGDDILCRCVGMPVVPELDDDGS